jgi:hypothetical protein
MILEGIVTTISRTGEVNIAPMGPLVDPGAASGEPARIVLRPYRTARTYANLRDHGEGVLHVTDDVLLLARAAVGALDPPPPMRPAARVRGWVLVDACRYHEFRVIAHDESAERVRLEAEVVHTGRIRDFFGFNRAKHAVVEAAILATRTALLPMDEIESEYRRFSVLVEKTGGPQEHAAFAFLQQYLQQIRNRSPDKTHQSEPEA